MLKDIPVQVTRTVQDEIYQPSKYLGFGMTGPGAALAETDGREKSTSSGENTWKESVPNRDPQQKRSTFVKNEKTLRVTSAKYPANPQEASRELHYNLFYAHPHRPII
jgi:hypothetical protein